MSQSRSVFGHGLLDGANYYWFFTGCMLATAVVYVVWSQFYRGETYIQDGERDGVEPAPHAPADKEAEGR